ncbi:alpha/beta hydrolase family esterase [Pseudoroseicyclus tamaricis]|uniref:Polyhydroxybutyrate depolymerase n=1 Tax=Pseudoroseicyclus tamaricis TaxID=2705421 RepID=A0A6B2JLC4_9RHOB|nr:PHB depolymerase family esterase [Pseudoroseicyclus tamaricis]NDV02343.1 hypothetical protein [Pseudoroseicyclus tamaricis]
MPQLLRPARLALLAASLALATLAAAAEAQGNGPIRQLLRQRAGGGSGGGGAAVEGLQLVTLTHAGQERSYYAALPPGGGAGLPVVMVFHGGEGDGTHAALASGLGTRVAAGELVALYPNAGGDQWNDGRAETQTGRDDVGFAIAVLADAARRYGIDPARAFAAGISNGGLFTQRLACEASGTFAAYGVIAATMPADLSRSCDPAAPAPMIFFNGTDDRLMPFGGGEIASAPLLGLGVGGTVLSAEGTRGFWARQDSCGGASREALADSTSDGTEVRLVRYECSGGAALAFYIIEGGGHNWPGSDVGGGRRLAGTISRDVDATAEMLAFFRRFGL